MQTQSLNLTIIPEEQFNPPDAMLQALPNTTEDESQPATHAV